MRASRQKRENGGRRKTLRTNAPKTLRGVERTYKCVSHSSHPPIQCTMIQWQWEVGFWRRLCDFICETSYHRSVLSIVASFHAYVVTRRSVRPKMLQNFERFMWWTMSQLHYLKEDLVDFRGGFYLALHFHKVIIWDDVFRRNDNQWLLIWKKIIGD